MAQFDVYVIDGGHVVDVQSDLIDLLGVRMVIPLVPIGGLPEGHPRLVPILPFDGVNLILATPLAAAVPTRSLGAPQGSLEAYDLKIKGAIDMLISGF